MGKRRTEIGVVEIEFDKRDRHRDDGDDIRKETDGYKTEQQHGLARYVGDDPYTQGPQRGRDSGGKIYDGV